VEIPTAWKCALICLATFVSVSCATTTFNTNEPVGSGLTAEMLLDESPLQVSGESPDLSGIDLLYLTPGMDLFLERTIDEDDNPYARLRRLMYAVVGEGQFDLVYDDSTRTAEETFRDQRGNCLSFTNMFIALARRVGLDAHYQEVDIPPSWSSQGQSLLLSQHVNVLVNLTRDSQRIVDFNMADFDFDYDRRVITDQRGRAHYFSNIGVERMLAGDTPGAFRHYRESLVEDGSFGPAWVNLGILYRREGYPDYAEAAFLLAVKLDESNPVALSNLSSLYEEQGDSERATHYRDLVKRHRMRNPYYRYQLAQADFDSGDYDSAIAHLEEAIRHRRSEDRFYSLMSSSYLMKGDLEEAGKWMKKAENIAVEYADKRRYNRKFEMLMDLEPGG
jgi:hypothetical protein